MEGANVTTKPLFSKILVVANVKLRCEASNQASSFLENATFD